jgi:uncharacterized integral membrane protein
MNDFLARFSAAPASFKKSYGMQTLAWVCHPIFIYLFFLSNHAIDQAENIILRMVVISVSLGFLLFLIKKWARALVVMGNFFIVVYDLFVLAVSPPDKLLTLLGITIALAAIMGTYWLFVKETRDYFDQVNPKIEPPTTPGTNTGPNRSR